VSPIKIVAVRSAAINRRVVFSFTGLCPLVKGIRSTLVSILVVWSTPTDRRRKRRCRAVQSQAMFGGYWLLFLRFERSFVLSIVLDNMTGKTDLRLTARRTAIAANTFNFFD
jgi:hypothetical protein